MKFRKSIVFIGIFLLSVAAFSQNKPAFWEDIRKFKVADSLRKPAENQILFVGSSSFTMWSDVQKAFPDYKVLNRGFGGSTLQDVIRYAPDIILPYNPSQIVIYCGENDLASADTVTPAIVYDRFVKLYGIIREKYPDIPVAFVSIKPSPSRVHLFQQMAGANKLIRDFLARQQNAAYIDVFSRMLDTDGKPIAGIFLADQLHMNAKGYAIWQELITPYLVK